MADLGSGLAQILPRNFLLAFEEGVRAAGCCARSMMQDAAVGRQKAMVTGQIRTALIERLLVDAATNSGFPAAEAGVVDGTQLNIYQAHACLGRAVVVRASIQQPGMLPRRNKSRGRLAEMLNRPYGRTKDLFSNKSPASKEAPIAVFLVVCPNKVSDDGIDEIAVAVVDNKYDEFVFYEPFATFLARYAPNAAAVEQPVLIMKAKIGAFTPPEEMEAEADDELGKDVKNSAS